MVQVLDIVGMVAVVRESTENEELVYYPWHGNDGRAGEYVSTALRQLIARGRMERGTEPHWSQDPTYNWRKK